MAGTKIACIALIACAALALSPAGAGGSTTTEPRRIAEVGAWCWFGDPRAIEYESGVVFGWVADDGSIMMGEDRGRTFNLHPGLQRDDHNNPSFYVRQDGRLTAFWSAHGGDALYYRTTAAADIAEWGPIQTMPANPAGGPSQYTYPNPVRYDDRLYLFWSGVSNTATFSVSADDGATWSAPKALFATSPYAVRYIKYKAAADGIHMAWTLVHPRWLDSAVYHAVIRKGKVVHQDGSPVGTLEHPLDPVDADVLYQPQTDGGAWIHDLSVDAGGHPRVAYATFPSLDDHTYRSAAWDGTRWTDEHVTTAGGSFNADPYEPQYSGGVTISDADPSVLFLSRVVDGQHEIERWRRTPAGWEHSAITSGSTEPNVRPFPVGDGLSWMRGSYPSYTRFRTSLVWMSELPAQPERQQPDPLSAERPAGAPFRAEIPVAAQEAHRPPVDVVVPRRPTPHVSCAARNRRLWRQTGDRRFLARHWRCRVLRGECRAAKRTWRLRRTSPAGRAYVRFCVTRR